MRSAKRPTVLRSTPVMRSHGALAVAVDQGGENVQTFLARKLRHRGPLVFSERVGHAPLAWCWAALPLGAVGPWELPAPSGPVSSLGRGGNVAPKGAGFRAFFDG